MMRKSAFFAARGRPSAGAAPDHLPELDLAEDRFGEDQVPNAGHVDAGIEHVHGDRHARKVLELEFIQGLLRHVPCGCR